MEDNIMNQDNSHIRIQKSQVICNNSDDTSINSVDRLVEIPQTNCDLQDTKLSQNNSHQNSQTISHADYPNLSSSIAPTTNADQEAAQSTSSATLDNQYDKRKGHSTAEESLFDTGKVESTTNHGIENNSSACLFYAQSAGIQPQNQAQANVDNMSGPIENQLSASRSDCDISLEVGTNNTDTRDSDHPPQLSSDSFNLSLEEVKTSQDSSNHSSNPIQLDRYHRIVELLPNPSYNDDDSVDEENDWVIGEEFYDLDILADEHGAHNEYHQAFHQFGAMNMDIDIEIENVDADNEDDGDNDYGDDDESFDDSLDRNNSDDDMEEVSETDGEEGHRNINYDTSLPARHNYLGENLEELVGRQILDEQTQIRLPILEIDRIILLPGQLLPINTMNWRRHLVDNLRQCFENGTRTFGFTCTSQVQPGNHGTTAEIRNYTVEEGNIKCIVEGSQRFKIVSTERAGPLNTLYGTVLILPELMLGSPYGANCSLSKFSSGKYKDKINCLRSLKYPIWIYKYYDAEELVKRIRDHLKHWLIVHEETSNEQDENSDVQTSNCGAGTSSAKHTKLRDKTTTKSQVEQDNDNLNQIMTDPRSFSYWVAGNLPVDLTDRAKALTFNCAEARLLWELSLLEARLDLLCANCNTKICSKDDAFSMSKSGPQSSFVNSNGYIHDTLTVYRGRNLVYMYHWEEQYSWFPGYAWRICNCNNCSNHIGWCFKTKDKSLKPTKFYGLTRQSIRLK